jgi:hypothetical protein
MLEPQNSVSQQHTFSLALMASALLHGGLLLLGNTPTVITQSSAERAGLIVQIAAPLRGQTPSPEAFPSTEPPSQPSNDEPVKSPATAEATPAPAQEAEPSEIVFTRPPDYRGLSYPGSWARRRYQNEEQSRARTISDFMQKLQPLVYQINPERCLLQTSADGRMATLHCNTIKDQQQLLSGIGPFLEMTNQLDDMGACFTMIGTQINVTKKCAPHERGT